MATLTPIPKKTATLKSKNIIKKKLTPKPKFTKEELEKYPILKHLGAWNNGIDGLEFQKQIRREEW